LSPLLDIRNLWFKYPSSADWVLRDINLSVAEGEFVCLAGPSGCGKSTLLLALNGIVPHGTGGFMKGNVIVADLNTEYHGVSELAKFVGLVQQNPEGQFRTLDVEDEVAFGPENCMLPRDEIARRVDWALGVAAADHLRDREADQLSGGEKQRVVIASALAMMPKVLVLDEPTSNIDMKGSFEILEALREIRLRTGLTVLVAEHKLDLFLPISDRFIVIDQGSILYDGPPNSVVGRGCQDLVRLGVGSPQVFDLFLNRAGGLASSWQDENGNAGPCIGAGELGLASTCGDERPEVAIDVRGLRFRYANGVEALSGLDLTIRHGEFVGITGTNGSGKTTFLLHLMGILKAQQGKVVVCGMDAKSTPIIRIARKVGLVFQNPLSQLFEESVRDELLFALRNFDLMDDKASRAVKDALDIVDLKGFEERYPHSLSTGQMKRLCIASVLIYDPDIVILDEPFFGQDYGHARRVMDILRNLNRERGKTILIVSHNISILTGYASHLIAFQRGTIAEDGPMWEAIKRLNDREDLSFLIPPSVRYSLRQKFPSGSKLDAVELSRLREGREWHGCWRQDIDM
jgi:energy-coupling factor transporter ATP-binding protein EcfA2